MSKPTPGPWNVAVEIFDNEGCPETAIQALNGAATVAVALDFGPNNPHMRDANARLIAAAPDHHAVALELDRLMLVIESAVRAQDPSHHAPVVALLKANIAAIAKATGGKA